MDWKMFAIARQNLTEISERDSMGKPLTRNQ